MEVDPIFYYDPADGVLSVFNAGPNGIDDTMNGLIDGDDFGLIGLLLTASSDIVADSSVLPTFDGGVAWGAVQFFNGKIQLSGNPVGGPGFLPISEDPVPFIQLLPDLTADDFRNDDGIVSIETGAIFTLGDAFQTGAFRIVPEPTGLSLMLILGLGMFARIRR